MHRLLKTDRMQQGRQFGNLLIKKFLPFDQDAADLIRYKAVKNYTESTQNFRYQVGMQADLHESCQAQNNTDATYRCRKPEQPFLLR